MMTSFIFADLDHLSTPANGNRTGCPDAVSFARHQNGQEHYSPSPPNEHLPYGNDIQYQHRVAGQQRQLVTGLASEVDAKTFDMDPLRTYAMETPDFAWHNFGYATILPEAADERQQIASVVDQLLLMKNGKCHIDKMELPPGYVMERIRVPYPLVGLVVGLKGANVKRIQKEPETIIVTPAKDREPIFMLIGPPENVNRARVLIEVHIERRTQNKFCVITLPPLANATAEQAFGDAATPMTSCNGVASLNAAVWSTVPVTTEGANHAKDHVTNGGGGEGQRQKHNAEAGGVGRYANPWTRADHIKVSYSSSDMPERAMVVRNGQANHQDEAYDCGIGFDVVDWLNNVLLNSDESDFV